MKIEIKNDNFFICQRLKEIDNSYFILYDDVSKKYQVHSKSQNGSSYCFTVPYNQLDARTIDFANKTKIENKDKILQEIDKDNDMLFKRTVKDEINKIEEALL